MKTLVQTPEEILANGVIAMIPAADYIANFHVGMQAPNAFGKLAEVVEVTYRGVDRNGRPFVNYYTKFGDDGARMSMSLKADELVRHSGMSRRFTSAECDALEREMLAAGMRIQTFF